jgi:hypothetical protein
MLGRISPMALGFVYRPYAFFVERRNVSCGTLGVVWRVTSFRDCLVKSRIPVLAGVVPCASICFVEPRRAEITANIDKLKLEYEGARNTGNEDEYRYDVFDSYEANSNTNPELKANVKNSHSVDVSNEAAQTSKLVDPSTKTNAPANPVEKSTLVAQPYNLKKQSSVDTPKPPVSSKAVIAKDLSAVDVSSTTLGSVTQATPPNPPQSESKKKSEKGVPLTIGTIGDDFMDSIFGESFSEKQVPVDTSKPPVSSKATVEKDVSAANASSATLGSVTQATPPNPSQSESKKKSEKGVPLTIGTIGDDFMDSIFGESTTEKKKGVDHADSESSKPRSNPRRRDR